MLDEIRAKLEAEVERLTHELTVTLPQTIRAAVELGDLRENADYKSALERQQFVQARLRHLGERLQELSNIEVESVPADRVGFGSRVRVRDLDTGAEDEYLLVSGDYMDVEAGHISLASPLGRGLMNLTEGEEATIKLPARERRLRIVELRTLHDTGG